MTRELMLLAGGSLVAFVLFAGFWLVVLLVASKRLDKKRKVGR